MSREIRRIQTTDAPIPAGHYSQATVCDGIVYVAGQLAIDPATGERRLGSIEEQTERTLRNVEAILHAAGSDWSRALKVTVYVADIALWGAVNAVYARVLGDHKPARAIVPTKDLHHGFLVEVDAIAATRD
jgi:2-iminobutanoate/2-iminopropanoate deaminase